MHRAKTLVLNCLIFLLISIDFITSVNSFAEERQEEHFYFVQITDTHFGDGGHLDRTQKAVELINNLPMEIKCVVHTGDITMDKYVDKKVIESGLSVLEKLTVPIHYVFGNRDIFTQKLDAARNAYIGKIGGMISHAEYNNVVFIFVYTEPFRKASKLEGYQLIKHLERYLKKFKDKPKIIFHHVPSVDDFYKNRFHTSWKKEMKEK